MFVMNELQTWHDTVQETLDTLRTRRETVSNDFKKASGQFNAFYSKMLRHYPKQQKSLLVDEKKNYQHAIIEAASELNYQIEHLSLMSEENSIHLFNMCSKYLINTVHRHFENDKQEGLINSLILQTNSLRSSLAIVNETLPILQEQGGFLTRRETMLYDKRLYYEFQDDMLVGIELTNDEIIERDRINIITTNFKALNNTIECTDISGKFLLYTATKQEAEMWDAAIAKQKEHALKGTSTNRIVNPALEQILRRPENMTCAECGCPDPQWISVNLGVVFCIKCSGIHRSLGVAISRVKSILLDNIEDYVVRILDALGNKKVNAIYQQNYMLTPDSTAEERSAIIQRKYVRKQFVTPSDENWVDVVHKAIKENRVEEVARALAHVKMSELFGNRLLIEAINERAITIACYLIVNGYDLNETDDQGETVLHLVARKEIIEIAVVLIRFKCNVLAENDHGQTPYDVCTPHSSSLISTLLRFAQNDDYDNMNEVMTIIENHLSRTYQQPYMCL